MDYTAESLAGVKPTHFKVAALNAVTELQYYLGSSRPALVR